MLQVYLVWRMYFYAIVYKFPFSIKIYKFPCIAMIFALVCSSSQPSSHRVKTNNAETTASSRVMLRDESLTRTGPSPVPCSGCLPLRPPQPLPYLCHADPKATGTALTY